MYLQVQKLGMALISCLALSGAFAQNTMPATGNVGVGTTNPTKQLQVVGETELDGRVTVDGYVDVQDTIHAECMMIDEDVKVMGESVMVGDTKCKNELKVLGTTKMKSDAFVEGSFRLKGLQDLSVNENRFALLEPNGSLRSGNIGNTLYGSDCVLFDDGTNTIIPAPAWQSSPGINAEGILFTGETCPAKVGIGTNAPTYSLDVRGSGTYTGALGIGFAHQFSGVQMLIKSQDKVGLCLDALHTTDYGYGVKVQIDRANTKAFAVYNNNNGSNGEDVYRVYGDGKVECKGVRVSNSIWSDHVFQDGYDLMSLTELESFIEENEHLPNVPSEQEVLEHGTNLGDMDAILLEKVEELTLYILEQQKEIDALKQQLEEQN